MENTPATATQRLPSYQAAVTWAFFPAGLETATGKDKQASYNTHELPHKHYPTFSTPYSGAELDWTGGGQTYLEGLCTQLLFPATCLLTCL